MSDGSQRAQYVPTKDHWETDYLKHTLGSVSVSIRAWIKYRDGEGQESAREIATELLAPYIESGHAILAYCQARQARRTFIVGRIIEFVDMSTGEVVQDIVGHLTAAYRASPTGLLDAAFDRHHREIAVLVFVARADGAMRAKQRDPVFALVRSLVPGSETDDADFLRRINEFAPSSKDYRSILKNLAARRSEKQAALLEAIEAIGSTRTKAAEFTSAAVVLARKALGGT